MTAKREKPIRVLIVDDHPLIREALAARISQEADMTVCGEAADADTTLQRLRASAPDVVVLDLSLQESHGLDLLKRIKAWDANIKALVLSAYSESLFGERALSLGADGYVNKQQAQTTIITAIRRVAAGKRYLSERLTQRLLEEAIGGHKGAPAGVASLSARELEVFQLIGSGKSTRAIADQLRLSIHTIETYREKIRMKLNLSNSTELVQHAVRWSIENG